jgi:hypothetical protein
VSDGQDSRGRFLPGHKLGFQPGQSGNPNGARGSITNALKREMLDTRGTPITIAEGIAKKLCQMALAGELGAIREILDRIEGKPRQSIEMQVDITDWREVARREGLDIADVIREARVLILESADEDSDVDRDPETPPN